MKLYSPDKTVLLDVTAIRDHPDGLLIEGKIMGAMPMRAILRPEELRAVRQMVGWPIVRKAVAMLFTRKTAARPVTRSR